MKKFFLNIIVLLLGMASCYAQNHAVPTNRKDFLRGLNNFSQDISFVQMDPKYTRQRAPFNYINREAYEAFIKMWEAAKQDGINLTIISGARTFLTQKTVWDRRWNESTLPAGAARVKHLLRYSALPGCSRHHWGTDIDLNANRTDYWRTTTGKMVYQWLCENAHKFGFYQPYSAKGTPDSGLREKGHEEERWHWSYYPLASVFMKEFAEIMTDEDLRGFSGDKYISTLDVINNFVLGVAPEPTLL
jgi:LAS superfamily LD-carboxypeptidase LdcB